MATIPGKTTLYFRQAADRVLKPNDVIRSFDGSFHFVQYVNSSGAYIVPLAGVNREIKGQTVTFNAGGRTISAHSVVEIINPLSMGGSSPEYQRYVKMVLSSEGKGTPMDDSQGTLLGDFDSSDIAPVPGSEFDADAGTVSAESLTAPSKGRTTVAKKAKKANGSAARERVPKKVRHCACGCGAETTGHFAPGHDARFHGWLKKLADGRIDGSGKDVKSGEKVIPNPVLKSLDLVATKEGHRAKAPHFYEEA